MAIEVLDGATLPSRKVPGKVTRAVQRFINLGVSAESFAVVIGKCLDTGFKRLGRIHT